MRHIFVLDETTIIAAIIGKNAVGNEDFSSRNLLLQIARNCHKIAWNYELRQKYSQQIDSLKQNYSSPYPLPDRILFHLLTTQSKSVQNENYYQHLDPDLQDDKHVISLSIFTKGILVTEDQRLKDALTEKSLVEKHDLTIVTPREALQYADEICVAS